MDRIEQTIRRKNETEYAKDTFKYRFFYAFAAVFGLSAISSIIVIFYALTNLSRSVAPLDVISLVLSVALTALFFTIKDEMLLEYDYIIEDDTLTIAKIKNLKARKEVVSLPISALKRLEPYNEEALKAQGIKLIRCTLNADAQRYTLYYERGEQGAIVFEPNEEMLKLLKKELNK